MSQLRIAEQFYSVQGEGPHAGTPAVFLRMAGCNLVCGDPDGHAELPQDELEPSDDATWVCDTIEVWREASDVCTPEELLGEWVDRGFLAAVRDGAHVVLTGGEPMLQQEALAAFCNHLGAETAATVEVETNGTVEPEPDFDQHVDQYNVSLKLANSGMERDRRIQPSVVGRYAEDERATFKLVVAGESDLAEVLELVELYSIPHDRVSLMPAGATREELRETYPRVAEMAKDAGWTFSPRLHVNIWDEMVGV